MSNPIKYSTGSESLALKKGNFYIGTGDVGKGPTSTTGYYNGITPPPGGYTIYLNKASGGPSIYVAANDAELVALTNQIAGTTYGSANECLLYFSGQSDKVCLNRDYEAISTNGLALNVDAGFTPSYPKNGTVWYDVSTTGNNGVFENSPSFSTDGEGSLLFDGLDDRINLGSDTIYRLKENMSFNFTFYLNALSGETLVTRGPQQNTGFYWIMIYGSRPYFQYKNTGGTIVGVQPNWYFSTGSWYNLCVVVDKPDLRFYVNSNLIHTADISALATAAYDHPLYIGSYTTWTNNWQFTGNIAQAQIYNRSITESEVVSNFNAVKGRFGL